MKRLSAASLGWGNHPLKFLAFAFVSAFATSSAMASPTCSIKLHNQSGVEFIVKMKILDARENVVKENNLRIANGATVVLPMDSSYATLSLDVHDNGRSIGGANYFDRQVTACELLNQSNQPICNNNPRPGEITLIRNNRNCP